MTILITGGTGKTGLKLAHVLNEAGHAVLLTSREGEVPHPFKGVKLDWLDPSTFTNPFDADPAIDRVYVVGPIGVLDTLPHVKPFIDLALTKGVKRFVVLSGSPVPKGGPIAGKVHEYLAEIGVDYAVLRPTWFIENFSTAFVAPIRAHNRIVSAAKDGRLAFVSVDDIAQAASDALLDEKSWNSDRYIVGPELFSYDEVAALLSKVLGREIKHKRLTEDESRSIFTSVVGLDVEYANFLVNAEAQIADGAEVAVFESDNKIVGKKHLQEFFETNRETWVI
ncbi:uncharacterized protein LACBIDRAFT_310140 [Laccaria bicolor S238N-H82]|uniref:Predicted protein n=1 Tax=Laccaria bicolor (strain S238N-H82 / ATCC MYA-4686) TaxID=486041 RepID=B0DTX2_LACBS|nr:uncharacterized protein LACBIDRAFT_310140 [Laccaria bicolor S238N-H82]EDR01986.1 predicted protein [Laccaria bicolor S238N-H82]|eukprot:XP_001887377.1 predicted protein [Laccaria bicolor S238N-H82]